MLTRSTILPIDLKKGIKAYCQNHQIRPTELGRKLMYADPSAYGWHILRGPGMISLDCLGRFAYAFGGAAVDELLTLCQPEGVKS